MLSSLLPLLLASQFTQITADHNATVVRFLDDTTVFARTEYHSGVWTTQAQQLAAFDTNQSYPPFPASIVQCGFIADVADWAKDGAAINVYDQKTLRLIKTLRPTGTTDKAWSLWSLSFNSDCSKILALAWPPDGYLQFFVMNVATGQVLNQFDFGSRSTNAAALNRDSSKMLVFDDHGAAIYNFETQQFKQLYNDSTNSVVNYPEFSPDGKYVVRLDSASGEVVRYDIESGERRLLGQVNSKIQPHMAFQRNNPNRFFVYGDELLQIDIELGTVMRFGSPLENPYTNSAICANNKLVMVSEPGKSRIYDIATGAFHTELEDVGINKDVYSCDLSNDGKHALIGGDRGAKLFPIEN